MCILMLLAPIIGGVNFLDYMFRLQVDGFERYGGRVCW